MVPLKIDRRRQTADRRKKLHRREAHREDIEIHGIFYFSVNLCDASVRFASVFLVFIVGCVPGSCVSPGSHHPGQHIAVIDVGNVGFPCQNLPKGGRIVFFVMDHNFQAAIAAGRY
jgi:hypothetical protein